MDEKCLWAKWSSIHVSEGIIEFLSSDYQKVRLTAIKNLSFLFEKSYSIDEQQNIFEKLNKKVTSSAFVILYSFSLRFSVTMYF